MERADQIALVEAVLQYRRKRLHDVLSDHVSEGIAGRHFFAPGGELAVKFAVHQDALATGVFRQLERFQGIVQELGSAAVPLQSTTALISVGRGIDAWWLSRLAKSRVSDSATVFAEARAWLSSTANRPLPKWAATAFSPTARRIVRAAAEARAAADRLAVLASDAGVPGNACYHQGVGRCNGFVAGGQVLQLAHKSASGVHAREWASCGALLHSALEFQESSTRADAGQQLATADRGAENVVGPGSIPGVKVERFIRVVEDNPIERLFRFVRERIGSRLGEAAAVDDQEIRERIPPPECIWRGIAGCLHVVTDGLKNPRDLVQQRYIVRNDNDFKRRGCGPHQGSVLPNAGIGTVDPLTTIAQCETAGS